jgi:hypothetical protein
MWKSHYYAEFVLWLDLDGTICHLQTAGHFGKAELQRNIDCKSMLQFEGGGKKKKKKKKKSELSLKKKNLEEERVDTQKMEKKNAKISLSLPLCLSVSLTHTTHMQSFFCAGKGEKYKKFQGHRKTTRTKTKKNLGICTLDNLADKLFCLVLEETKKEGTYLGWDFIACTKQNFFCNNSFIQSKKTKKNKDLKKRKSFCLASKQEISINLFSLSLGRKEIVGPCAKTTIGEVVLLEIFFFFFFLATDYCSGGGEGRKRVVPKSATRPKIRPAHNHPLHQPR